ncbi:MAG TPA: hypothetical protein VFV75_16465 [Candidatus Polarisedimenticolaceae bacterium]|nr:hypothetical protein [Candidatus Polarisedimenticolaceae bacterium]
MVSALAAVALLAAPADLNPLLERVAARARVHRALLYRFACTERIDLLFQPEDGGAPTLSRSLRNGIVVERNEEGKPREARVALAKDGTVRLDDEGEAVPAALPEGFGAIAQAFPHALAASFDRASQGNLTFRRVPDGEPGYVLACPAAGEVRLEFLDARTPRRRASYGTDARCQALASGQMCVDPASGEIHQLVFYAVVPEALACTWDREHPFSVVEQNVIEPGSGVRFPSSIVTRGRWKKEAAVFRQTFSDCTFFDVRTEVEVKPTPAP